MMRKAPESAPSAHVLGRLEELRDDYARRLPDRVEELQRALDALGRGEQQAEQLRRARRVAMALAGSAGTFGFARVGEIARTLGRLLCLHETAETVRAADLAVLRAQADELQHSVITARDPDVISSDP